VSDADLIEMLKQHFIFLRRLALVDKVREVKTNVRMGSRKAIVIECDAAIAWIDEHQYGLDR